MRGSGKNRQPRARRLGNEALRGRLSISATTQLEQFDGMFQLHAICIADNDHRLAIDRAYSVIGKCIAFPRP